MKERMILSAFLVAACSLILRAVDVVEEWKTKGKNDHERLYLS